MIDFKKIALTLLKGFFAAYPTVDEFHVTKDEQVFEHHNDARNHAKTLCKDAVVVSVKRAEVEAGVADEATEPTADQKLEAAKQAVADATATLGAKQQALTDATPQQKGSRSAQVKKAEDALVRAKDALAELMK